VKIRLYYVGKPRDAHANAMAREYIKRATRYGRCEMHEIRPQRTDPWKRHPGATMIALDPAGRAADSAELLRMIERAEREARDLVFLRCAAIRTPGEYPCKAGGGVADRTLSALR